MALFTSTTEEEDAERDRERDQELEDGSGEETAEPAVPPPPPPKTTKPAPPTATVTVPDAASKVATPKSKPAPASTLSKAATKKKADEIAAAAAAAAAATAPAPVVVLPQAALRIGNGGSEQDHDADADAEEDDIEEAEDDEEDEKSLQQESGVPAADNDLTTDAHEYYGSKRKVFAHTKEVLTPLFDLSAKYKPFKAMMHFDPTAEDLGLKKVVRATYTDEAKKRRASVVAQYRAKPDGKFGILLNPDEDFEHWESVKHGGWIVQTMPFVDEQGRAIWTLADIYTLRQHFMRWHGEKKNLTTFYAAFEPRSTVVSNKIWHVIDGFQPLPDILWLLSNSILDKNERADLCGLRPNPEKRTPTKAKDAAAESAGTEANGESFWMPNGAKIDDAGVTTATPMAIEEGGAEDEKSATTPVKNAAAKKKKKAATTPQQSKAASKDQVSAPAKEKKSKKPKKRESSSSGGGSSDSEDNASKKKKAKKAAKKAEQNGKDKDKDKDSSSKHKHGNNATIAAAKERSAGAKEKLLRMLKIHNANMQAQNALNADLLMSISDYIAEL